MTRMKESGIDWIGQIPEEWEMSKIRYLVATRSEKRITDSSVPYIGLENIESQTGKFVETGIQVDKSENIVVEIGDVLFGKLRPYLRKYWRATFTSTASSEFLVFQSSELDMNFLYYAIQSDSFIEEVNTSTYGSKMPRASWEYIKNMRIAFPTSLVEQQKIAGFLDKKTAQLDKAKNLLEEQIQKLKDYRASLIYETVTKGLDKTVPMKDSGIDWIGQVPQGWEISKIRYLVTTRSEKRITDSSIPYIGLENIESQTGKFVETGIQVDKSENIVVEIGDVLFGKLRPYLRKFWRATFPSTASSEFLVFQSSELDMNFLYYAIQSDSFIEEVNTSTYGSKMPRASWEYIKNMKITFPSSLVEQQKIANLLYEKTAQIDNLIQIKNQQIKNINKQRQTLIYDYVTGKRRV
ncbi:restriction endonuclease subunit S [Streptococcus sp. CCUG 71758]|uniref:restriction endonuclease subunit S n=1 Tax=Streptococcus sp. CCUG 71758 TaxID=2496638 RepID=UPI0014212359|nr:restriction endonuclease subunit S [Streptococcus sp. CCUG 71758]NIB84876.1 restriction endonuclease subunit S [Streptococcus sp. CCUG 71758]